MRACRIGCDAPEMLELAEEALNSRANGIPYWVQDLGLYPPWADVIAKLSLNAGLFNSMRNVAEALKLDVDETVRHVQRINDMSIVYRLRTLTPIGVQQ